MQQPVEDGRGDDLVVEDLAPVREALVAGDDEAGPLLATDQESEEEASLRPREGQVAELVEDEHAGIGELLEGPVERFSWRARTSRPIRLSRVRKRYGMARLDGLDPDGLQGLGEKALVVEVPLGRVLADAVELGQEVLHLHPLEEGAQFHVVTSS
jgi:hypothetical protein